MAKGAVESITIHVVVPRGCSSAMFKHLLITLLYLVDSIVFFADHMVDLQNKSAREPRFFDLLRRSWFV